MCFKSAVHLGVNENSVDCKKEAQLLFLTEPIDRYVVSVSVV